MEPELAGRLGEDIPLKGEFVVLVAGRDGAESVAAVEAQRIYAILADSTTAKEAVALTAKITGMSRNDVYQLTRVPD